MASITKVPAGYRARWRTPDGKSRSETFRKKAAAERHIAKIEGEKVQGAYVDRAAGRITVATYAEDWIKTKGRVRPRTLINVDGRLRNHILPAFGQRQLASIRPSEVRAWVASMERAPATVKATFRTFSQLMRTAELDGVIARSPCIGVELPAENGHVEMHFLTPAQVDTLADAITPRYQALVYTAAFSGLRAGELAALTLTRVNLLRGTFEVTESLSEVRGALAAGPTKTGRARTVRIPRFLAEMLAQHLLSYPSTSYLFTAAEGGPIRHRNFYQRHFRPAVMTTDLTQDLRFHDLRHTCAAILISEGWSMEQVKRHLGHSTIRVTSDRYGHLFEGHDEELLERLDERFRQGRVSPSCHALPRQAGLG